MMRAKPTKAWPSEVLLDSIRISIWYVIKILWRAVKPKLSDRKWLLILTISVYHITLCNLKPTKIVVEIFPGYPAERSAEMPH